MGNRAVITFTNGDRKTYSKNEIGVYLHWNGSPEQVEQFLADTRKLMGDRLGDVIYAKARLMQVIGNAIGGNLSFGVGLCSELDTDNGDNGTYLVDPETMMVVERR